LPKLQLSQTFAGILLPTNRKSEDLRNNTSHVYILT